MNSKIYLLIIYLTVVLVVVLRVYAHPINYTTLDSLHYLDQSEKIVSLWTSDVSISQKIDIKQEFTIWPIGYPATIALVSYTLNISSLWASKIVNLIFLGFLFILLHYWFGSRAWFISLVFFSYNSLEIVSHTWSETPFIFLVILLSFVLKNEQKYSSYHLFFLLTTLLTGLFLFRYIGLIFNGFILGITVYNVLKKENRLVKTYLLSILVSLIFAIVYFYHNFSISGNITGIERVLLGQQSFVTFSKALIIGISNEFLLARNISFNGSAGVLFITFSAYQTSILLFIRKQRKYFNTSRVINNESLILIVMSALYLLSIILIKIIIPIDDFDFRVLAPFSTPLLMGLFAIVSNNDQKVFFKKVNKTIVVFMIASLIINIPKTFLTSYF